MGALGPNGLIKVPHVFLMVLPFPSVLFSKKSHDLKCIT